jgi:hypothetical protein
MDLAIVPDGAYRTYALRLADSPEYKGVITGLRYDPVASGATGEWVRVKSIGFEKVE